MNLTVTLEPDWAFRRSSTTMLFSVPAGQVREGSALPPLVLGVVPGLHIRRNIFRRREKPSGKQHTPLKGSQLQRQLLVTSSLPSIRSAHRASCRDHDNNPLKIPIQHRCDTSPIYRELPASKRSSSIRRAVESLNTHETRGKQCRARRAIFAIQITTTTTITRLNQTSTYYCTQQEHLQ